MKKGWLYSVFVCVCVYETEREWDRKRERGERESMCTHILTQPLDKKTLPKNTLTP
jgi:hypothetical protein